jgi:protein ImuB
MLSGLGLVSAGVAEYTEHMFRYLVAHAPTFRLDRCGWSALERVALVAEEKNALRVQAATPAAQRQGVRRGMSISAARARVPDIQTELLDPAGEAADLQELTAQLLSISPSLAPLPPDSVVAEVSRVQTVRGGQERAIQERVRIRMQQLGHAATVVIADDPATAHAVATWQRRCQVIPPGEGARALAALPLLALGLPPAEHALLCDLGLTTIGAFAALPPASVPGRLGPLGVAAHAMARGHGPTPNLPTWRESGTLSLTQDLHAPVTELEALLFVLRAQIRDATARLAAQGQGATRMDLQIRLESGACQRLPLRLGAPTRDPDRMLRLLRDRMDKLQLAGPAVALTLSFPDAVPFTGSQLDLQRRTSEALSAVTARLQDTLGGRSVLAARSVAQHRPEAAWRPVRFSTQVPSGAAAAAQVLHDSHAACPVHAWQGHPAPVVPSRPPILLRPPQAVEVAPPLRAVRVDGRWQDVVSVEGPEQVAGEWWSRTLNRSYWRVTLGDGRVAWLYQEDERWALHGWWDR